MERLMVRKKWVANTAALSFFFFATETRTIVEVMVMAKMTKKEKKEKIDAVKALDTQIVQSQKAVAEILTKKGADSPEYKAAVENLKALAESRAVIAETIPKRCKVDPTAFVTGAFGLGSTFLLLVYDDEHTVPKWFHNGLDMAKSFLRK